MGKSSTSTTPQGAPRRGAGVLRRTNRKSPATEAGGAVGVGVGVTVGDGTSVAVAVGDPGGEAVGEGGSGVWTGRGTVQPEAHARKTSSAATAWQKCFPGFRAGILIHDPLKGVGVHEGTLKEYKGRHLVLGTDLRNAA